MLAEPSEKSDNADSSTISDEKSSGSKPENDEIAPDEKQHYHGGHYGSSYRYRPSRTYYRRPSRRITRPPVVAPHRPTPSEQRRNSLRDFYSGRTNSNSNRNTSTTNSTGSRDFVLQ